MIFPAGQAFSFQGGSAQLQAQQLLREFGDAGASIEESRPGYAKVRISRDAVFGPRQEAPINRGTLPDARPKSIDRSSPFRAALVVALLISFLILGGVASAEVYRDREVSAPAVVGAAGAQPYVWLNGRTAVRGGTRSSGVLAELTTGSKEWDALATFAAGVVAFAGLQRAWKSITGQKEAPKERLITPSPLIVTPAKEWATVSEVTELKQEVHRQVTDLRAYVHKGMHDLAGQLHTMSLQNQEREERLLEKLEANWKGLSTERSASTARLYERIDATAAEIGKEIDAKVGETHQRINELTRSVGELVGELRASRTGGRAK